MTVIVYRAAHAACYLRDHLDVWDNGAGQPICARCHPAAGGMVPGMRGDRLPGDGPAGIIPLPPRPRSAEEDLQTRGARDYWLDDAA